MDTACESESIRALNTNLQHLQLAQATDAHTVIAMGGCYVATAAVNDGNRQSASVDDAETQTGRRGAGAHGSACTCATASVGDSVRGAAHELGITRATLDTSRRGLLSRTERQGDARTRRGWDVEVQPLELQGPSTPTRSEREVMQTSEYEQ
jgi:hypothetical protein